jgi:hypothetical protein
MRVEDIGAVLLVCLGITAFAAQRTTAVDYAGLDAYLTDLIRTEVLRLRAMKADGLVGFFLDNPTEEELVLLAEHYAAMASERDHLDPPGGIAARHDSYVHLWDLDAEIAMLRAEGLSLPAAASTLVPADQDPWAELEQNRQLALVACPEFAELLPPPPAATPAATPAT